jgi:CheY-like chemotaxis protein
MGAKACKVLLVDDSEDDRALFQLAFRRAGTKMELLAPVDDGDDAISYLSGAAIYADRDQHPYPQVLVLDLKMPGRSGFEVLEWLRQQAKRPLIIVLSGSDHRTDIERALSLGADFYQIKPPGLDDWVGTIKILDDFCTQQLGDRQSRD